MSAWRNSSQSYSAALVQGDGHTEDAALPGLLEDQLAVLARQRGLAFHDRDHAVHREVLALRGHPRRQRLAGVGLAPAPEAGVVHRLAVGTRLPGGGGELVRGEGRRRRQAGVGVQHGLDVIVEGDRERVRVDRVEPLRLAVEEQERHVGEGARSEAAADRQVDDVTEPPPLPLAVEGLGRDRREAVLGAAAAAAGGADEELTPEARHVDPPPVAAHHDVAPALVHGAGAAQEAVTRGSATPMSASRVISGTSSASLMASVPAGLIGRTM